MKEEAAKLLKERKRNLVEECSELQEKKKLIIDEVEIATGKTRRLREKEISISTQIDEKHKVSDSIMKFIREKDALAMNIGSTLDALEDVRVKKSLDVEKLRDESIRLKDFIHRGTDLLSELEGAGEEYLPRNPLMIQDIKDVGKYNSSKLSDKELRYDWAIVCSWWKRHLSGSKIKHDKETILRVSSSIVEELSKRSKAGKTEFKFRPAKMKESSRNLFEAVTKRFPKKARERVRLMTVDKSSTKPGLYLVEPHGRMMWEGNKTLIVKSVKFDIADQEFNILSGELCYGLIRITGIDEITEEEFKAGAEKHRITPEEKEEWGEKYEGWRNAPYYSYSYTWVDKYEEPKEVSVPQGVQGFVDPGSYTFTDAMLILTQEELASFVWVPDFISLTGSAAYQKREPADVDLIVKTTSEGDKMIIELDPALNLKIEKIFKKIYPGKPVHWTPSSAGADHDHVPLWDLVLVPKPTLEMRKMNEPDYRERYYDDKKLKPGTKFPILKPMHGRYKAEEYSVDSLIKLIESRKTPWFTEKFYAEPKYDGDAVHVSKTEEGEIIIHSSGGRRLEDKLPTLKKQLENIKEPFLFCGEIEHWVKGIHSPRQTTTGIIHSKEVDPKEKDVRLVVYDVLYWKDKDIHNEPFFERIKLLDKFSETSNIKKGERTLISSEDGLRKAVDKYSNLEGSEGCYLKLRTSKADTDGATLGHIKFKRTQKIDVLVKSVYKVKGVEAWNYLTTLQDGTPTGKTLNTSIKADIGDAVRVEFVEINRYETSDTKRVFYSLWNPRVVSLKDTKIADNKATAEKLVKASGGVSLIKPYPKRYLTDANPFMTSPLPESRKWKGMMQFDARKKAVHIDARWQTDSTHLVTFTLFLPVGLDKVPESVTEAKSALTTQILPTVKEILADPLKKFNCIKENEIEASPGVFSRGDIGMGPGEKYQPRYMQTWDTFEVEHGCKKQDYIELFLSGGEYANGKLVFVKIKNREEWKKTPIGLMTWMAFITKDPTPYVLSRRAVTKKWIAPYQHSALPRKIRNQIVKKYQYWNVKGESARRAMRDELVEALNERKEVQIDLDWTKGAKTTDAYPKPAGATQSGKFKLQKQTYTGKKIVRKGSPSRTEFHLLLNASGSVTDFVADEKLPSVGLFQRGSKTRWEAEEGDIEPNTKLNETKATPSELKIIDSGRFRWMDSKKTLLKLEGKKLKGIYSFTNGSKKDLMTMKRIKSVKKA